MISVFPLFSPITLIFPALDAGCMLLVRVLIGPLYLCFRCDWPSEITLVLVYGLGKQRRN